MGEKKLEEGGGKAEVGGGGNPEKGPVTVVLKMELHCEGCAKKVKRSISNLQGVEKVKADCDAKTLTVIGNDHIDPSFIREKVEEKTKKKVELISPHPNKSIDEKSPNIKAAADHENKDKDKKSKEPVISTVVMKIRLHCSECANKIKRIILKNIDGVDSVTTNLEKDLVTVNGKMGAKELATYLQQKLKRGVDIVPQPKKDGDEKEKEKDEKKESGPNPNKENGEEKSNKEGESKPKKNISDEAASKKSEETKAETINNKMEHLSFNPQTHYTVPIDYYYHYDGNYNQDYGINNPKYHNYNHQGYYHNTNYIEPGPPPPSPTYLRDTNGDIFNDENPNGCFVM